MSTFVAYPGVSQRDYAVLPLIVSGGPDGASSEYGVAFAPLSGWHPALIGSTPSMTLRVIGDPNEVPGYRKAPDLAADNITNHDLLSK